VRKLAKIVNVSLTHVAKMGSIFNKIEYMLHRPLPHKARFTARKLPPKTAVAAMLCLTTSDSMTETQKPLGCAFPKESRDEMTNDTAFWFVTTVNDEPEETLFDKQTELGRIRIEKGEPKI
jgi:hypothetical protein